MVLLPSYGAGCHSEFHFQKLVQIHFLHTEHERYRENQTEEIGLSSIHYVGVQVHSPCRLRFPFWVPTALADRFVTVNCRKYPFKGRLELIPFDFLEALARIVLKILIATTSAEIKALRLSSLTQSVQLVLDAN